MVAFCSMAVVALHIWVMYVPKFLVTSEEICEEWVPPLTSAFVNRFVSVSLVAGFCLLVTLVMALEACVAMKLDVHVSTLTAESLQQATVVFGQLLMSKLLKLHTALSTTFTEHCLSLYRVMLFINMFTAVLAAGLGSRASATAAAGSIKAAMLGGGLPAEDAVWFP